MARKPRVEFEGALYHVIVQGNHRCDIFRDRSDRIAYLRPHRALPRSLSLHRVTHVLMSNHVHLLVETGAVRLSKIMQGIQFRYTQRYNRRYRVVDHLFHHASVYAGLFF